MAGSASAAAARVPWTGRGRISSPADVELALAAVPTGVGRAGTGELRRPVAAAGELVERGPVGYQPVHPLLAPLLPWSGGLRRGSVVAVTGATSLLFALLAPVVAQGGYAGVVGAPELGLLAASEHGLDLARLALVPAPGPDWPAVVAALVDGLDVVAVNVSGEVPAGLARSLAARARGTGTVLVPLTRSWPAADLVLTGEAHDWAGLGAGRGRLREHRLRVSSTGRGAAARRRELVVSMPLPAPAGLPARQAPPVPAGDVAAVRRSA